MNKLTILALALGLVAFAHPGSGITRMDESRAAARHFEVRMRGGNSFDPATLEVKIGDTITWINDDENSFHTATSNDGSTFDTNKVESLSHSKRIDRFIAAGTLDYHCTKHLAMRGRITVTP
jgi:plastocyanin